MSTVFARAALFLKAVHVCHTHTEIELQVSHTPHEHRTVRSDKGLEEKSVLGGFYIQRSNCTSLQTKLVAQHVIAVFCSCLFYPEQRWPI